MLWVLTQIEVPGERGYVNQRLHVGTKAQCIAMAGGIEDLDCLVCYQDVECQHCDEEEYEDEDYPRHLATSLAPLGSQYHEIKLFVLIEGE